MADGSTGVLVADAPLVFEPTSGSSGAAKLIPYTADLKAQFRRGVNTWLHDLYRSCPGIRSGTHFWSITPAFVSDTVRSSLPVGFEDDAEYLGRAGRLLRRIFAVPNWVRGIHDPQDFHAVVAVYLLNAEDLTLVSVWSPSAWLTFADDCIRHGERAARILSDGAWNLPSGTTGPVPAPRNLPRAVAIARLLAGHAWDADARRLYRALWPHLALISAWGDAESEPGFRQLSELFSWVRTQKKGLLATEGIMSLPLHEAGGAVPAFTSHFFEFAPIGGEREVGRTGPLALLGDLEKGERYRVVLTTGGGLYRYAIGDIVEVDGFFRGLPILRFVARDCTSDLVGEKLNETFARDAAQEAFRRVPCAPVFALLSPDRGGKPPRYILYVECPQIARTTGAAHALALIMEERLLENCHYASARKLGQLDRLGVFLVESKGMDAYVARALQEGARLGDIKPRFLDSRGGWDSFFSGTPAERE